MLPSLLPTRYKDNCYLRRLVFERVEGLGPPGGEQGCHDYSELCRDGRREAPGAASSTWVCNTTAPCWAQLFHTTQDLDCMSEQVT